MLESLTALAILAVALTSLFDVYATGLGASRSAQDYTRAQILARSLLAQTTSRWAHPLSSSQGTYGEFRWRVTAKVQRDIHAQDVGSQGIDSRDTGGQNNTKNVWALYHVVASVSWDRNRRVQLETLRLARK